MREWVSGDGRVRLINGDCMEYMRGLPDKAFSLAIVDPEYGINITASGRLKRYNANGNKWDEKPADAAYFSELERVSVNQIIWGGNYFALPATRCFLIWDKQQPQGISFADCEMAWTSFDESARTFRMRPQGADVDGRIHSCQKPVALYRWLLHNYAKEGDRILDTHGGSMSSVCACHEKGFVITCCELDADYYDAGLARVQAAMRQHTLDLGV